MEKGFTMLELVAVIVLVAILAVGATALWQGGLDEEAAASEFRHALRYAQHLAMTREYDHSHPWGVAIGGATYSVRRKGGIYAQDPASSGLYKDRQLPGGQVVSCPSPSIWFDRFGAPIGITSVITCTVGSVEVKIYPETGFVE